MVPLVPLETLVTKVSAGRFCLEAMKEEVSNGIRATYFKHYAPVKRSN